MRRALKFGSTGDCSFTTFAAAASGIWSDPAFRGESLLKISGHLTESTFERYNIVDSTDLHEAMANVEKYFDGNLMAVEENQQQSVQQDLSFQSMPR